MMNQMNQRTVGGERWDLGGGKGFIEIQSQDISSGKFRGECRKASAQTYVSTQ